MTNTRLTSLIKISAQIARESTSSLEINVILKKSVKLINDRFGFYFTGIFLVDKTGQIATLKMASGTAGEELNKIGLHFNILPGSPIGNAISSEKSYIINDVTHDPLYHPISMLPDTKAELIIPLKTSNWVLGALDIHSVRREVFPKDSVIIYEILADQIALALDKARLFENTLQRIEREHKIIKISNALKAAKDFPATLQIAVKEFKQTFPSSRVQVILQRQEAGIPTYTNVSGVAIDYQETYDSTEIWTEAGKLSVKSRQIELRPGDTDTPAVIAVPFTFGEFGAGILEIVEDNGDRWWIEEELILVEQIIKELSQSLEYVLLQNVAQQELNQRKTAEEEILRRNQELARLNQIGQKIGKLTSREEIFKFVYQIIGDLLDNRNLVIALYSSEDNTISFPIYSIDGKLCTLSNIPFENGIPEYVIRSQNSLLINGRDAEEYYDLKIDPLINQPASLLAIPLVAGSRSVGMMMLNDFTNENAYSYIHLELLSTIASQVTAALENVNLLEQLKTSLDHLKELDRLKSQFLANMSHELRNPLNSIIGFSRVIMKGIDGPVNEIQFQDLDAIYNSGQHLLNLINDVLDVSKIEAGKMDLVFSEVDMKEIIPGVMATIDGLVKDKSIVLNYHIPSDLPVIRADPTRIRQVLLNLLSNAAKFTDEGRITVQAKLYSTKDRANEMIVTVTDTGSGINVEDQKKLFLPFSQVDGSPTRKSGGTGLGLSICRSLIELHHGKIGILNSESGKGSTFYFTLPLNQPEI